MDSVLSGLFVLGAFLGSSLLCLLVLLAWSFRVGVPGFFCVGLLPFGGALLFRGFGGSSVLDFGV